MNEAVFGHDPVTQKSSDKNLNSKGFLQKADDEIQKEVAAKKGTCKNLFELYMSSLSDADIHLL